MADNISITAGSGTTIATDDSGSGHVQIVKLALSADGSKTALTADNTNGMLVSVSQTLAEDAAHTTGDKGIMALGVRTDSPSARSGSDGDYEPFQITNGRVATTGDGGCGTATLANVSTSTSSATLLASNAARRVAIILNDAAVVLYVKYGTTASSTSLTYALQAGETLKEDRYTGIITGTTASSTGTARVTELTV